MSAGRAAVLVTGASGFVGSDLLTALGGDHDLTACSRRPVSRPGVTWLPYEELVGSEGDLQFDVVVHLAGNADHGLAVREPWSDLDATGGVAARLLSKVRARRLVVLSSAAVYAGLAGPVSPKAAVHPLMAYALSKLYVEGLAATLTGDGRFGSLLIVRLYNAYGPGERPTRLIPRIVMAARSGSVFRLTGDPSSLSDPVHVRDVTRLIRAAAAIDTVGTYDLCGGDPRPLGDQVRRVAEVAGLTPPEVVVDPDPDQVAIKFWSDPMALTAALGVEPVGSFEEGVQAYIDQMGPTGA